VLSIFFAGGGVGLYLSGRLSEKSRRPLLYFSFSQLFLGVFSFFSLQYLLNLNFTTKLEVLLLPKLFNFHFLLAITAIGVPSILLGCTIPLLSKFYQDKRPIEQSIFQIYGVNTIGGAIGALLAGFYCIPYLGVENSNILVFFITQLNFLMIFYLNRKTQPVKLKTKTQTPSKLFKSDMKTKFMWLTAFLIGFSSMGLEFIWTRYLGIYFGSSFYSFSLVLFLYLLSIGIGPLIIDKLWLQKQRPLPTLRSLLFIGFCTILLSNHLLGIFPKLVYTLAPLFNGQLILKLVLSATILIPPNLFLALVLPITVSTLTSSENRKSLRTLGNVFALNTLGSIIGSLTMGILLYKSNQNIRPLVIPIAVLFLLCLIHQLIFAGKKVYRPIVLSLLTIILITLFPPHLSYQNMLTTFYLEGQSGVNFEKSKDQWIQSTIYQSFNDAGWKTITKSEQNGNLALISRTNGVVDGSYPTKGKEYQKLKMLLKQLIPSREKQLLLGNHPIVKKQMMESGAGVWVANSRLDLSKTLENYFPIENNFGIQSTSIKEIEKKSKLFNTIISSYSHPWASETNHTYTENFYHKMSSHQSNYAPYIQLLSKDLDKLAFLSIAKSFYKVFPFGAIFEFGGDQLALVGSKRTLRITPHRAIISSFIIAREDLMRPTKNIPHNSTKNSFAEIRSAKKVFFSTPKREIVPYLFSQFRGSLDGVIKHSSKEEFAFIGELMKNYYLKKNWEALAYLIHKVTRLHLEGSLPKIENIHTKLNSMAKMAYDAKLFHLSKSLTYFSLRKKPNAKALNLLLKIDSSFKRHDQVTSNFKDFIKIANPLSYCLYLNSVIEVSPLKQVIKQFKRNEEKLNSCGPVGNLARGKYFFKIQDYKKAQIFIEMALAGPELKIETLKVLYLLERATAKRPGPRSKTLLLEIQKSIQAKRTTLGRFQKIYKRLEFNNGSAEIEKMKGLKTFEG
jgi:hypothetical protein